MSKSKIDAAAGTLPVAEARRLRALWSAELTRRLFGFVASMRLVGSSLFLQLDRLLFGSAEHR